MEYAVTIQIDGVDVTAGRLFTHAHNGVESASFAYSEEYLRHQQAFALAPDMPLVAGTLHSGNTALFAAFEDCMPDRWGRNLLLRAERKNARTEGRTQRTLLEADFLVGASDTSRQGALRIWEDGIAMAPQESGVPHEIDIPALLSAADAVSQDMDTDITDLLYAGSSLGGARPKASVLDENGRLCIAKFSKPDEEAFKDTCAWEYVALQLAAKAGIAVPGSRLLRVHGRSVLLVQRFDRNGEVRIPYLSGLSAVQGEDGENYSYLELVDFLEEFGATPQEDIRQLWLRVLFSCAIGNTDDHMRNHGFLHEVHGWRLSPAFDINPTPGMGQKYLSTALDLENREADVAAALEVCDYYRVSKQEARQQARAMGQVLSSWRQEANKASISKESVSYMQTCFEAAIAKLLAQ